MGLGGRTFFVHHAHGRRQLGTFLSGHTHKIVICLIYAGTVTVQLLNAVKERKLSTFCNDGTNKERGEREEGITV